MLQFFGGWTVKKRNIKAEYQDSIKMKIGIIKDEKLYFIYHPLHCRYSSFNCSDSHYNILPISILNISFIHLKIYRHLYFILSIIIYNIPIFIFIWSVIHFISIRYSSLYQSNIYLYMIRYSFYINPIFIFDTSLYSAYIFLFITVHPPKNCSKLGYKYIYICCISE